MEWGTGGEIGDGIREESEDGDGDEREWEWRGEEEMH
jgi:hypothetical protein